MAQIVGIRFRNGCKTYYFGANELPLEKGQTVVVETAQGQEMGTVTFGVREMPEKEISTPLKNVLRIATDKDLEQVERHKKKEAEAFSVAEKKIAAHGLDMKLVRVEYAFDGSKVVFHFTSDGRIDFRDLVKDLAGALKTRIELRQIGARDETRMLGGLGPCGLPCCCNSFLNDFVPVSIKMAKEQGLSLNPAKISGLCGRLMCCLTYEQKHYEETRKKMPRINAEVITPDGTGKVLELNMLKERMKVLLHIEGDAVDIRDYANQEVRTRNADGAFPPAPERLIVEEEAPAEAPLFEAFSELLAAEAARGDGAQPDKSDRNRGKKGRHKRGGKKPGGQGQQAAPQPPQQKDARPTAPPAQNRQPNAAAPNKQGGQGGKPRGNRPRYGKGPQKGGPKGGGTPPAKQG